MTIPCGSDRKRHEQKQILFFLESERQFFDIYQPLNYQGKHLFVFYVSKSLCRQKSIYSLRQKL